MTKTNVLAIEQALRSSLDNRRANDMLRSLSDAPSATSAAVDFSSNDYLSLSTHAGLPARFLKALDSAPRVLGAGASRLLDGNSDEHVALERRLATFFGSPAALLFNSGFDANSGFFASVPQDGDAILYDEFIHASVHDGMRASRARHSKHSFSHNSVHSFSERARSLAGYQDGSRSVFVAVEALYSMDGDFCPLQEFVAAAEEIFPRGNCHIIVDEAHSTGICGPRGRGLVAHLGLEERVFATLHTFGKALGCSGGECLRPLKIPRR